MALAHFQRTFTDAAGNIKPGLAVTVRRESDNGLAALFADAGSVTAKSNPFNTDANGYGSFYVTDGRYRIQATDIDWRNEDLIGQPIVDFGSTTDDVDTIVKSGFYRVESNANLPSGSDYGQLIVSRGWDTIMQLVSSYNGRLWQRSGNPSNIGANGSYSDWQEIPSLAGGAAANFASMPQVGGDPIVESGSNTDGEWAKWSDGTMTQFGTRTNSIDFTNAQGDFFRNFGSAMIITLPLTFFGTVADYSSSVQIGGADFQTDAVELIGSQQAAHITTSEIRAIFISQVSATETLTYAFQAIGRWK